MDEGDLPSEKVDKLGLLRPLSLPWVELAEALPIGRLEEKRGKIKQLHHPTLLAVPSNGDLVTQPLRFEVTGSTEAPDQELTVAAQNDAAVRLASALLTLLSRFPRGGMKVG